jgi:putative ABC transport system permease protein
MSIDQGRFFTEEEDKSLAKVVVLGEGLKKTIFKDKSALGEKVKIGGQNYKVIGVMEPYSGISGGVDINDMAYLPLRTVLKTILGIDYVSEIDVMLSDSSYINQSISDITRLLRKKHRITDPEKDDFQIMTMTEIISQINQITTIMNLLLGFLAAISLLVGGIGIMNIMLVSVSERTREIGLRKALGASYRNVLYQFLIEALVVTGLGGIIGVFLGIIFSTATSFGIQKQALSNWPIEISWLAITVGFSISVCIGLFFGLWPAKKAAALDPIRAIKKEN